VDVVIPELPNPVSAFYYENDSRDGKQNLQMLPLNHGLLAIGMVCDAIWSDYDKDGWIDLVVAGEWMPLKFLKTTKGNSLMRHPVQE
jgi:hypothetical protein